MPAYPKRLLNPEFVEAVRNAPMTRCTIAQLVGYGPHHSNLGRDLTRPDGTPHTLMVRGLAASAWRSMRHPAFDPGAVIVILTGRCELHARAG